MKFRNYLLANCSRNCSVGVTLLGMAAFLASNGALSATTLPIPNHSFESPVVPQVAPYAGPSIDDWQKSAQPIWYDPSQNNNTPWEFLMGSFFNVPFPGTFIENCDGIQASFLFALPEAALFQDYDSLSGTNTIPTHAFDATFKVGASYDFTVAVLGGGGGMKPGATLLLSLYYRDAASNQITVASTSVTNSPTLFPTNTQFVDFQVRVPTVKESDPWAGKHIGIQLLSTTGFELAGGYWDLDNARLTETLASAITLTSPVVANGQFSFDVISQAGSRFEIQATTNIIAVSADWVSLGAFTNATGVTSFSDPVANSNQRYYRARQL